MSIYESKNRGKIMEKLFPPPPHKPREGGGGLFDLPCTQGQLFMDGKLFNGTTKYQNFLLSLKLNLFGLHKIAWCPWQSSDTVAGSLASRPKIDTCVLHILS